MACIGSGAEVENDLEVVDSPNQTDVFRERQGQPFGTAIHIA